jgi:hypothetical protein
VAIKVGTDSGYRTAVSVTGATLTNATTAAIMLQSWDSTSLGRVTIESNDLKGAPPGYAVWQVGSTALGAGSVISGNTE